MSKVQIIIPTGYEIDQKKAEAKRAIAKLMMERSLQTGPMQSWLQVLGQVGSAIAGKRLEHKADKMDADVNSRMLDDYTGQLNAFHADAKILSPTELVAKYQNKPFLEEALKPYMEAMTTGLKEGQEHTNFGGQWRSKAGLGEGEFEPNKPTDSVLRGPGNSFIENDVRRSAALHAQGYDMGGAGASMRDPGAPPNGLGEPIRGPVGAPNAAPGGPPPSPGEPLDLSLLSPDERAVMTRELQRRAANRHTPMGNPLTPPPPDGVAAGKPYWMVNGVPYDNPEGK